MKIIAVLCGIFFGASVASAMIWGVGYQICEVIGVDGYEQPAYFTAFVLWPLYGFLGAVTGGATMFALVPGKKKEA